MAAPTVWPVGITSAAAGDNALNLAALEPTGQASSGVVTSTPQPVHGSRVFNNSGGTVYVALDTVATLGAIPVAMGQQWTSDDPVSVLHVYTPSAVPINGGPPAAGAGPLGTTPNSITVWGLV